MWTVKRCGAREKIRLAGLRSTSAIAQTGTQAVGIRGRQALTYTHIITSGNIRFSK